MAAEVGVAVPVPVADLSGAARAKSGLAESVADVARVAHRRDALGLADRELTIRRIGGKVWIGTGCLPPTFAAGSGNVAASISVAKDVLAAVDRRRAEIAVGAAYLVEACSIHVEANV